MSEVFVSPADLYDEAAIRRLGRFGLSPDGEQEVLNATQPLPRGAEFVEFFDSLHDKDLDMYRRLQGAVSCLPPKRILEHYGEDGLAYVAATAVQSRIQAKLIAATGKHLGYDTGLFQKARIWNWQTFYEKHGYGGNVITQYRLFDYLQTQSSQDIDLSTHLKQSAKPGLEISDARAADYSLLPVRSVDSTYVPSGRVHGWHGELKPGTHYDVWLDAPTGLMLTYKDEPQAIIGLSQHTNGSLFVNQLQGIRLYKVKPGSIWDNDYVLGRKSARGLAPLDWQKLLLGIAAEVAQNNGMNNVVMQSGTNNKWTKPQRDSEEAHITVEQAERAYDQQAVRFGFTHDAPKDDWQISTTDLLQATITE